MVLKLKTFWKVDQKYLESFEMWCWRRMKKQGGEEYPTCNKRRKTYCIGHILHRNRLLKHMPEGKIGVVARSDGKTRKKT
jgi:hypothetical protein